MITATPYDAAQLLTAARQLLAQGWCQNAFALDALDKPVSLRNQDARRFDLEGALILASGHRNSPAYEDAYELLRSAAQKRGFRSIGWFNDAERRTQAEVLALVDEALSAVQQVAAAA